VIFMTRSKTSSSMCIVIFMVTPRYGRLAILQGKSMAAMPYLRLLHA
jgi:hypothetical protein